jgi:hypothetical protein
MHQVFSEVVKEISVRKVEMKIKSKSRLNPFENENSTLISINSFIHPYDYWVHLNQISSRVKEQVEADYSKYPNTLDSLDFLEFLYSDLRDIRSAYLPEDQELILDSVQVEGLLKYRSDIKLLDVLKKKCYTFSRFKKCLFLL